MLANGAVNLLSLLVLCTGGCRDEELIAPPSGVTASPARVLITSDSACAQVSFLITGTTTVQTTFPDRAACTSKLVVIRQEAAQWAQSPNRRLRLRVRILNRSGQVLQLPIRLYLPASGTTVLAPTGQPASKVVAVEADSSEAGGGRIWFIGGAGTIAANDSTVNDTLMFNVQSPVTQARFQFQASAATVAFGGWPILYGTYPVLDTSRIVALPGDTTTYFRTNAELRFAPGTSDSAKQAILTSVGATVIGVESSGVFFIQFPDPGTSAQSFLNFLANLQALPGVSLVVPIQSSTPAPEVFGRLPNDGSGQARSDWVNGSLSTWAPRAIRAPLAWGCENGRYGGALVRVGILEWKHDTSHPEFAGSTPVLWEPDDARLRQNHQVAAPTALVDSWLAHSTGVTGIATASGDDTVGVAGVMWRTRLYQYAGLSSGNRPANLVSGFSEFADRIAADSIQVLSISSDMRLPKGQTQQMQDAAIENLAAKVRNLLTVDSRLLIVVAAGNDKFNGSFATYSAVQGAHGILAALLKVRGEPAYQDRIIVVAGTQQNNQFWASWYLNPSAGSNFFTGLTDIAAPAQDLVILDRRTSSAVPITPADRAGTSYAAPRVAGVAAQLLAMDSTLSPNLVKSYILLGAQQPRFDPATGTAHSPSPVTGGGGVFQLDAYGSLSMLSKQATNMLPICGYDVRVQAGTLVLDRNGSNAVPYSVPSSMGSASVAQGGRRIALGRYAYDASVTSAPGVLVIDYLGSTIQTLPTVSRRVYLERDTADLVYAQAQNPIWVSGQPRLTITGPGRTAQDSNIDVLGPVVSGSSFRADFVEVDPTGQFAATLSESFTGSGCTIDTKNTHLIPLHSAGATLVRSFAYDSCNPQSIDQDSNGDQMTFSPDGTRALFSAVFDDVNNGITGIRSRLYEYSLPALSFLHGSTVQDYWIGSMRYGSDGLTVLGAEADLNYISGGSTPICRNTIREDAPTFGALVTSSPAGLTDCNLWGDQVIRPNLRALSAARFARKPPAWAH
jgi:hypothetical protein